MIENVVVQKHPLIWPVGYPRNKKQVAATYKVSAVTKVLAKLRSEIYMLSNDRNPVISTNVPVRRVDGSMYTDTAIRVLEDSGAAVYFIYQNQQRVIACDKWNKPIHNLHAIALSVNALRAIPRHGASKILETVLAGMIPELPTQATAYPWWQTLGVDRDSPPDVIKDAYIALAKKLHPDNPQTGDRLKWDELNIAFEQSKASS